jgi:nitroreductase
MMDAMQAIMGRRSIRQYEHRPVDSEQVDELLRAAMAAPSAGNQQPWRFVVVTDRTRLDALATTSPYAGPLERAPLAVVVCGDTVGEKHPGYWVQDCSAAMQNLLLSAHAIGLGAVWLGYYPDAGRDAAARALLGMPETMHVLGIAAIGWPSEEKPPADRYQSAFVRHDAWE